MSPFRSPADHSKSHLVVASGASNTNSLRVVRSGVGLEEVVTLEGIEGIVNLWTLSSESEWAVSRMEEISSHTASQESDSPAVHIYFDHAPLPQSRDRRGRCPY